jgi:hypothetical protein
MFVSLSLSLALFCRRNFPSHHHGPHDDACPVVLCVPNLPRLQSCSNLCVICECLTSPLLLFAWFLVHCTGAADQLQEEPPPHYKAFLHQLMIQSHPCHRRLLRPWSCTRQGLEFGSWCWDWKCSGILNHFKCEVSQWPIQKFSLLFWGSALWSAISCSRFVRVGFEKYPSNWVLFFLVCKNLP